MAGVLGGDFSDYARPPNLQSGKYCTHLDKIFKMPELFEYPNVPCRPTKKDTSVTSIDTRMSL
eukprot:9470473-Pyramimonas_sp.AAC.1